MVRGVRDPGEGEPPTVEVFIVPNILKIRAAAPGGRTMEEMIEAGTRVVAEIATTYAEVAAADIDEIDGIASAMGSDPEQADAFRPELMRVGLNLKGQAATMGYPLLTEVAMSLTDFLDDLKKYNRRLADDPKTALPVVHLHVQALRLLMAEGARDDDGPIGRALIAGLKIIVAKALPEKTA